jgi:predicted nuclease with RNAse H fold
VPVGHTTTSVAPVRWLGVDVGGARKGFDIALIDDRRLLALARRADTASVVEIARTRRPVVVAIDSPRRCAPDGHTAREDERALAKAVCGIRWTPDAQRVHGSPYYEWIVQGLALFAALADAGIAALEVFPTASWTRWLGPRGALSRAQWSRQGLTGLGLSGLPARTNQDQRDAIAAAVTARLHTLGQAEAIGDIIVPGIRQPST